MSGFTEEGGAQKLQTSKWTVSVEAGDSGEYGDLMGYAREAYQESSWPMTAVSIGLRKYADPNSKEDVEAWREVANKLLAASDIYNNASQEDQNTMYTAWLGDVSWLFPGKPRKVFAADKMSRYILSGVVGEELLAASTSLKEYAKRRELSPLDAAVLVGGAAMAGSSLGSKFYDGGGRYLSEAGEGEMAETWTGGDSNGDFRTSRHIRPVVAITTSLRPGDEHVFMPVAEEEYAAAGQNAELEVIEELLFYLVERGSTPQEVHAAVTKCLESKKVRRGGGAFADFGGAAWHITNDLRLRIDLLNNRGARNFPAEVTISQRPPLLIISEEDSVRLIGNPENQSRTSGVVIPAEEVPDYIATIISGGGGRTSAGVMKEVVDALVEPDPYAI